MKKQKFYYQEIGKNKLDYGNFLPQEIPKVNSLKKAQEYVEALKTLNKIKNVPYKIFTQDEKEKLEKTFIKNDLDKLKPKALEIYKFLIGDPSKDFDYFYCNNANMKLKSYKGQKYYLFYEFDWKDGCNGVFCNSLKELKKNYLKLIIIKYEDYGTTLRALDISGEKIKELKIKTRTEVDFI